MPSKIENLGVLVVHRPVAGNTQTASQGIMSEPVDLRGDMKGF